MKCSKARECFDDYLTGVLEDPALSDLKAHLESCRNCRDELSFLETVHQKTAGLPEEKAPADLLVKIHARIEAAEKQKLLRKFALWTPQFAGVAVVLILVAVLFKLNSQPILKESGQKMLTQSNEAGTLKNTASSDAVKPAAPAIGSAQKRMSANIKTPSGGITVPTAPQALTEAKVAAVEMLVVKVIPVNDNKLALADKAEVGASNLAPPSLSKGLEVQKEKTDSEPSKIAAPDPVKSLMEKYQGHIANGVNTPGKDEWTFEISPEKYPSFLEDLSKIGQVVGKNELKKDDEKKGEIVLQLKLSD